MQYKCLRSQIKVSLVKLLFGSGFSDHLWFLPVISAGYFAVYLSNKYIHDWLGFIIAIVLYFICLLMGYYHQILNWIPTTLNNNYIGGISFCLLGVFFQQNQDKIVSQSKLFSSILCFGFVLIILETRYFFKTNDIFRADFLIGTFFYSAGTFCVVPIFKNVSERIKNEIIGLSNLSLGVYLVHPLVLHYIGPQFKEAWASFNPFIMFHVLYFFVVLGSIIVVIGLLNSRFSSIV